jgi:hypothetical protein
LRAQQPTTFDLTTFPLQTVFATPELITSLSEFSYARLAAANPSSGESIRDTAGEHQTSLLLLRILAAADYFSPNKTLMQNVPPVYVDITLDPYVLNVLPRSLIPTVGVLLLVAVVAWFLASRVIVPWIKDVVADGRQRTARQKKDSAKKKQ